MAPLAGTVGLKVGPLVLETLVKHYFERVRLSCSKPKEGGSTSNLRQDELLYDQIFSVVKTFLDDATKHTVEELQEFGNTRTPSPPWVRVVRLTVPLSCCDEAAKLLIKALGGEEATKRVVGGTKWWQVRGIKGVPGEWITTKKDWREAKARADKTNGAATAEPPATDDSGTYQPEMDEQRCILYIHGGGYYFGSVDQERYSIQRFARKINGRVFATNYRLCPQYPFPCAIQDTIASYLYLIQPPPDAPHCAVKPEHIIVMGSSAGGGLVLALLQVIRDVGLPAPASAVVMSPWCDMSHSFPSIHLNTATDVLPYYGLSLYKPSTLWPPPPEQITNRIHQTLKSTIRNVVQLDPQGRLRRSVRKEADNISLDDRSLFSQKSPPASPTPIDLGAATPLSNTVYSEGQKMSMTTDSGETLVVDTQMQLYAPNNLLAHPLISPVGAYLGGLPPLFFIAGDKEVLRDEVIYVAHRAANPDKYPITDQVKKLCPTLEGIETKYGATRVHLQVYDECAHVLPILFAFTTPAKYCFRAVAGFCRYTTGMLKSPAPMLDGLLTEAPEEDINMLAGEGSHISFAPAQTNNKAHIPPSRTSRGSKKGFSGQPSWSRFSRSLGVRGGDTLDVGGPRFTGTKTPSADARCAGDDPYMYIDAFEGGMIRERVSTRGVIRPLEPEQDLSAFQVPLESVGVLSELSFRRYIEGKSKFDKKFARTIRDIEKQRQKHFELAKKEGIENLSRLHTFLTKEEENPEMGPSDSEKALSGSWNWAWALDEDENPPPSSIASRRDTSEARRLAKIADFMPESAMSGNKLWSNLVTFLTVTPDKDGRAKEKDGGRMRQEEVVSLNAGGEAVMTQANGHSCGPSMESAVPVRQEVASLNEGGEAVVAQANGNSYGPSMESAVPVRPPLRRRSSSGILPWPFDILHFLDF